MSHTTPLALLAAAVMLLPTSPARAQSGGGSGGSSGSDPASLCKTVTVTGTPSPLFCKGTNRQKFIADLYALGLKRQARDSEITGWEKSGLSTQQLAAAFVQAPEFQMSLVNIIYKQVLKRTASPDEAKYWANQGDSRNTFINVEGSDESQGIANNDDDAFITKVYQDIAGRAPTDQERSAAADLLSQGDQMYTTLAQMVYDTHDGHLQRVNGTCGLYQTILDRQGETKGVTDWTNYMDGNPAAKPPVLGAPYESVVMGFLGSQEMLTRSRTVDPKRFCGS